MQTKIKAIITAAILTAAINTVGNNSYDWTDKFASMTKVFACELRHKQVKKSQKRKKTSKALIFSD